jgi:transposase
MRSRIEPMKKIARSLRESPRTDPQLFPGSKAAFQRRRRGPEQQGQSHHEKILRLSHLPCLELALYHSLGKLPEPESTHDFF